MSLLLKNNVQSGKAATDIITILTGRHSICSTFSLVLWFYLIHCFLCTIKQFQLRPARLVKLYPCTWFILNETDQSETDETYTNRGKTYYLQLV